MDKLYKENMFEEGYSHLNELIKRHNKRIELGFTDEDFILISVGELNDNKNHEVIIRALSEIEDDSVKYIICGHGELKEYLEKIIIDKNLKGRVKLLGYRDDIKELLHMSDVFAFPSKREGLGLAAIEAMAAGLPLITSCVGGIKDYTEQGMTGFCIADITNFNEFTRAISTMHDNVCIRKKCAQYNKMIVQNFSMFESQRIMERIYKESYESHLG